MWRRLIWMGALCAGGAAAAQETLDDLLGVTSVFDCIAGAERTVYVFRSDGEGDVTLLGEETRRVSATDDGFLVQGAEGDARIAGNRYLIFRGGEATPGTCLNVTAIARGVYPAMTAGYLPDFDAARAAEADPARVAADVTMRDLSARLDRSQAAEAAANATIAGLQEQLAEATAEVAALNGTLAEMRGDIAAKDAEAAKLRDEIGELRAELAAEWSARLETAALAQDLAARLAEANAQLENSETGRRALAAATAVLGEKAVTLEGALQGARDEAEDARTETVAMRNLADSAVQRIATLQQRDPASVRAEVCLFLQGDRPGLCP